MPSRWDQANDGWFGSCVARALHAATPARKPFITHLNMKTVADCQAYIDKVQAFGNLYSPGKLVISASAGGYGNANWLIDNKRWFLRYELVTCVSNARPALIEAGISTTNIAALIASNTASVRRSNAATSLPSQLQPDIGSPSQEKAARSGGLV